jgi:hypothetical protein
VARLGSGGWRWSSNDIAREDLTDAWRQVLNANYREWDVPCRVGDDFSASVRSLDLSGIKLVECVCDPCAGERLPRQLRRTMFHISAAKEAAAKKPSARPQRKSA